MRRIVLVLTMLLAMAIPGVPRTALAEDNADLALTGLLVTPTSVDVTSNAQIVTVQAQVADPSRVTGIDVSATSPEGRSRSRADLHPETAPDGTVVFVGDLTIERYVEAGVWRIDSVSVREDWERSRHYYEADLEEAGLATSFEVISPVEDTEPPQVVELAATPAHVELDEGQDHAWVTIRIRIRDSVSGVHPDFGVGYIHATTRDQVQVSRFTLVSGDAFDGVYEASALIETATTPGSYWARTAFLTDVAGNRTHVFYQDVAGTGHPSDLHVGAATVPSEPRDVAAAPGDASARVTWNASRFDGTRAISGYEITAAPGGITTTAPPDATSAVVDGLTNGTAYTFDVVARNDVGTSLASRSRAVRATATPDAPDVSPPTVTSLKVADAVIVAGQHETVDVAVGFEDDISGWVTEPGIDFASRLTVTGPDGESRIAYPAWKPLSGHELEGIYAFRVDLPPDSPEGRYAITNVQLWDQAGNIADYSQEYLIAAGYDTTFDVSTPEVPGGVGELTATAAPGTISLQWAAPADDGGSAITGYEVQRDGAPVATVDGSTTSWTDQDVPEGATLTYTVTAVNDVGRSVAVDVTVQALRRPDAVQDLTAVAEPGAAQLAWSAPADDGGTPIAGYRITRDGHEVATVAPDVTQITDAGLAADTAYTYTVVALNDVGASPAAEAGVRTPATPSAPQEVTARGGSGVGEIVTSWEAPSSDGRSAIVAYVVYRDGAPVAEVDAETRSYTDTGRSLLETPAYSVAAVNAVGIGAMSAASCSAPSPWPAAVSSQLCG